MPDGAGGDGSSTWIIICTSLLMGYENTIEKIVVAAGHRRLAPSEA